MQQMAGTLLNSMIEAMDGSSMIYQATAFTDLGTVPPFAHCLSNSAGFRRSGAFYKPFLADAEACNDQIAFSKVGR